MKKSLYFFLVILSCLCLYAQQEVAQEIAKNQENIVDTTTESPLSPYYGWSWEIGGKIHEKYPTSNYSYWISPTSPFRLQFDYSIDRTENDRDAISKTGILAFLPFGIDFSGNQDYSKGLVTFGFYGRFLFMDSEEHTATPSEIPNLVNAEAELNIDNNNYGAGLCSVWSFPEQGLQVLFNLGYMWNETNIELNDLLFDIPGPAPIFPAEITERQREGGIESVLYIRMNTPSRNFLSGFVLQNFFYYRTEDPHLKSFFYMAGNKQSVDMPSIQGNFIQSDLYAKLYSRVLFERTGPLPFRGYYTQKTMMAFELLLGVRHTSLNDGVENSVGCRLNIFDNFFISYRHTWQHNNDASDSNTLLLSFEGAFSIWPKKK